MLIFLIVVGLCLLGLFIWLVLFIISKLKGGIAINVDNYNAVAGGKFIGTIDLKLRNPLDAESLNVGLVGYSKRNRLVISNGRSRNRSSTEKVYDSRSPISGKKIYPAGKSSYKFKLEVPANLTNQLEGTLGQVAKVAQMAGVIPRTKWYLISNLKISGLDIKKKIRVNID